MRRSGFIDLGVTLIAFALSFSVLFILNNYKTLYHYVTSECPQSTNYIGRNPDGTKVCVTNIKIEPIQYPKVINEEMYDK